MLFGSELRWKHTPDIHCHCFKWVSEFSLESKSFLHCKCHTAEKSPSRELPFLPSCFESIRDRNLSHKPSPQQRCKAPKVSEGPVRVVLLS